MNRYMEAAVAYLGYPLMAFRRWRLHSGRERGESRSILILRPDRIGDFVVTTPFLREVRRNFPNAHITLVASPACYELAAPCPCVDEVLTYQESLSICRITFPGTSEAVIRRGLGYARFQKTSC